MARFIDSFLNNECKNNIEILQKAKLIINIIFFSVGVIIFSAPLQIMQGNILSMSMTFLYCFVLIFSLFIFKKNKLTFNALANTFLSAGIFLINFSILQSNATDLSTLNYLIIFPLMALLVLDIKKGWIWYFFITLNAVIFILLKEQGIIVLNHITDKKMDTFQQIFNYISFSIIIFFIGQTFEKGRIKVQNELEDEKNSIQKKVDESVKEVEDKNEKLLLSSASFENANKKLEEKQRDLIIAIEENDRSKKELERHQAELEKQHNYLERSVKEILSKMEEFANGNLNVKMDIKENDSIGKLFEGFNLAVKNINNMFKAMFNGINDTDIVSQNILKLTGNLSNELKSQMFQTEQVSVATQQIVSTASENTVTTTKTSQTSSKNKEIAIEGGRVVEQTIEKMNEIAEVVTKSTKKIYELGESSQRIGDIVEVIKDIAEQTNLLALNAAIEAARAGEHGRGFAIVAGEVRKLSERTSNATKEIGTMISGVQKNTEDSVSIMNDVNTKVKKGIELANNAGDSLHNIMSSSEVLVDMINQLASASEEQTLTNKQISLSIDEISNLAGSASEKISTISQSALNLNELTRELRKMSENFQINFD